MKLASSLALALIAVSGAAAAPPVQAAPLNDTLPCFLRSDLRNHTVGDAHTMYFDVAGRDVYRFVMSNACLASVVSSDPIVLRNRTGSGRICHKTDLDVSSVGGGCIIERIEKLTPEEVAALPKKVRP